MRFKLFEGEQIDQQEEKHAAYIKEGYELMSQRQEQDGSIIRTYSKIKK